MIGRDVSRDEINALITDYFLADTFEQQVALTDIIMDQMTSIPMDQLTVQLIADTIEKEVKIWMRINQK
jgi:hypothetical protein